jgi:aspartyl-tRNA(Asn)/glutamyl-tRNA(Gln) amidotransferase subunit B
MEYQPTIGLEIHAELKTATKMFCDCPNDPMGAGPNVNTCPVCLAHPGTLPVPNKKAVEDVVKVGLALGGKIADVSKFDRKNYFYPDIPKAYQISQYDQPIVSGGVLKIFTEGRGEQEIRITRVHLEEDTATSTHDEKDGATLVDFNRSGVPLMELVTEPDLRSAEEVAAFARSLQAILRYLGVSEADMDRGQMRIEANVSLNMGTKTELKNINSFSAVESAVKYEIIRQREALEKGEKLIQETRGWDEAKRRTFSQRSKEQAHDYRYFPEPDIPPFHPAEIFDLEIMKAALPELPAAKRDRFMYEYGLTEKQAAFLVSDKHQADWFESAISEVATTDNSTDSTPEKRPLELLYNYFTSDLLGQMNESGVDFSQLKITPGHFADLINMVSDGKIGSRQAKDLLAAMFKSGDDPGELMKELGLESITDESAILDVVKKVIDANPKAVAEFKAGKEAVLMFLVGTAMRELKGRANPEKLKELFRRELSV